MTLVSPAWLWVLLLLLPLFALRVRAHVSSRKSLKGLVAPRLYSLLVTGTNQIRHWMSFGFAILGLAMIIVALARPQWGVEEVESYSEGRSVILAIDTSRSMLATDLVPNRLERAKLAARDIVDTLGGDRIGLIAFAGKAFMQAPLTTDHEAVIESIEQIDTEIIPRGGTNLTAAATLALSSFREADAEQNALILFSDGEALEGQDQVKAIKEDANREKMIIITIGVGTENGSIIPEPGPDGRPQEGVYVKDTNGQVVRTRLDSTALRELATGGGIYLHLGDNAALSRVVKNITANLAATRKEDVAQQRPIERFMWPLSFGLFFLVFSHVVHLLFPARRRRNPVLSPVAKAASVLFLLTCCGGVSEARDGWDLIKRNDYESALKHFEQSLNQEDLSPREVTGIQLGIGSAAYKLGDYERATKAYGQALIHSGKAVREQAHYNLGNTLFRKGETTLSPPSTNPEAPRPMAASPEKLEATLRQWLGALEHYEAALKINQRNADARHNIEVLKRRIEELKQEQQEPPKEEPQKDEQKQDPEEQKKDDQEKKDPQDQKGNPEEEKPKDQSDENKDQSQKGEGDKEKQDSENPGEKNDGKPENQDGDKEPPPADQGDPTNGQPDDAKANQPPDPGDGELSADESAPKPQKPGKMSQSQKNPETGYSPSEARQRIEALADEDGEVRPVFSVPYQMDRYKNW